MKREELEPIDLSQNDNFKYFLWWCELQQALLEEKSKSLGIPKQLHESNNL
jgi:hypothetical protein